MRTGLRCSVKTAVCNGGSRIVLPGDKARCRRVEHTNVPTAIGRTGLVLGIESSCDDTGVAVVGREGSIVSERLARQTHIHKLWGGVVPRLAQEAHKEVIDDLVQSVMQDVRMASLSLDAVAVTVGPGLSLCLRVGVEAAVRVSAEEGIPLIPIHHMEAHALVARMSHSVDFPFLCLLISGGHNLLLLVHGIGMYTQIGTTVDDSLGEAYDKVARMLALNMVPSGGAALEIEAGKGDPSRYSFKIPMQKYGNCDFSYSGLKTSVRLAIETESKQQSLSPQARADIAASFQSVAVKHLQDKCSRAIQWAIEQESGLSRGIVVAGGVAANAFIRQQLKITAEQFNMHITCPPPRLCTDNGVMVAWAGMERFTTGSFDSQPSSADVQPESWIDLRPRWPLTERMAFDRHNKRAPKRKRLHTSLTTMTEKGLPELTALSSTAKSAYVDKH